MLFDYEFCFSDDEIEPGLRCEREIAETISEVLIDFAGISDNQSKRVRFGRNWRLYVPNTNESSQRPGARGPRKAR